MNKIFSFLIVAIMTICGYAQDSLVVEPLLNVNAFGASKAGILGDKTIADGTRIVYGNTILPFVKHVDGNKNANFNCDPIAVNRNGEIMYGFTIRGNMKTPVAIKTGGKVLIKTSDETTYEALILYGCPSESHASSKFIPNLTGGSPIAVNVSSSLFFAHIVMSEEQYVNLITKEIVKMRLETEVSQIDTEIKGSKLQRHLEKSYPVIKEAISKSSNGFSDGF